MKQVLAAIFLSVLTSLLTPAATAVAATCGDGILDGNEECDPGGGTFVYGDPDAASCSSGGDCFYAFSCCKFNCQFANPGPCNDGDACTVNDKCDSTGNCSQSDPAADATACDDGLFCTTGDTCTGGVCSGSGPSPCTGGAECQATCDEANDSCIAPQGTPCSSDGNECTDDVCDGAGSCRHENNTAPCDDGIFCNGPDTCSAGACTDHTGAPCLGGGECSETCDEIADDCSVPDGTACTSDGNTCTDNQCIAGSCEAVPNSSPCDDGLYCTDGDTCSGGSCTGGPARDCSGLDTDCSLGTCDENLDSCQPDHFDAGTACTSDSNECTDDVCDGAGTCLNTNNSAPCDDGLFCNGADTCSAGACQAHAGDPCSSGTECADTCDEALDSCNLPQGTSCSDDGNSCTDDTCNGTGSCEHPDNPLPCDDGLFCTDGDVCSGGTCQAGGARDCSHLDSVCGTGTCDENGDACAINSVPDGDPCDDGLFCTTTDSCQSGVCTGNGDPCAGGTACTDACTETPSGANCIDPAGNACDSDGDTCTDDICDGLGNCTHPLNTAPCDDGDPCTVGDTCSNGSCISGGPNSCDDEDQCTIDSCDSGSGCINTDVDFVEACNWMVLAALPGNKKVKTVVRNQTRIAGDVCTEFLQLRTETVVKGDVVATEASNKKTILIANNVTIVGDTVTGGGGISGKPSKEPLPGLGEQTTVTAGNSASGNNAEVYDATGTHSKVSECNADSAALAATVATVDALSATVDLGDRQVESGETFMISPGTTPGVVAGARNVIDFGRFRTKADAAVVLDGGGDPNTSYILRFSREFRIILRSTWTLQNGLTPGNVLIHSPSKKGCRIGEEVTGAGVVYCGGKLQVRRAAIWDGAFVSPKQVDLRDQILANHSPFLAGFQ